MYILKILRCLWLARCILICCSSVSLLLVVCGVFNSVKIMSFFMYVISPPPFFLSSVGSYCRVVFEVRCSMSGF